MAGTPVLSRIVSAVHEVAAGDRGVEIWIAGPLEGLDEAERARVHQVFEEPRFAGPLAGIDAAVAALPAASHPGTSNAQTSHSETSNARTSKPGADDVVLLLAGDLPFVRTTDLEELIHRCAATGQVATCRDAEGHLQYLHAAWPLSLLRDRLAALEQVADRPVGLLYRDLDPVVVDLAMDHLADFDTPEDLRRITATAPDGCRHSGSDPD